jgi:metal-dependent amidase/aminoacylase/carboxypeptidase family protein
MKARHFFAVVICVVFAVSARGEISREAVASRAESLRGALVTIREDLHRHPELAGNEKRTAEVVARKLRELGLQIRKGVGGHGVVGILRGGKPGPIVGYRADMDSVPSPMETEKPYKSVNAGAHHLCGHDVHVTVALGIASILAPMRGDLAGTVMFIFQPAEETLEGALAMLNDGVFNEIKPEVFYAVHSAPFRAGQIGCPPGNGLSGIDFLKIDVKEPKDKSALANELASKIGELGTIKYPATPEEAQRMIAQQVAADGIFRKFIFLPVYTVEDPEHPDALVLRGTVKAFPHELYLPTREKIREVVRGMAGAGATVTFGDKRTDNERCPDGIFPAMLSDLGIVNEAIPVVEGVVGKENTIVVPTTGPFNAEDFAFFLQEAPGAMFWLGVANPEKGISGMPHSPDFDADDEALVTGAKVMTSIILNYMAQHPTGETNE